VRTGLELLFQAHVWTRDGVAEDAHLFPRLANRWLVAALFDHLDFQLQPINQLFLVEGHGKLLPGSAAFPSPEVELLPEWNDSNSKAILGN